MSTQINILLVEDEHELLISIKEILSLFNFNVQTASDGFEALEFCKNNLSWIHIVVCDYQMPKMNGYDFFKQFRMLSSDIPFVFLTGNSDEKLSDCVANNARTILIDKPIHPKKLIEKIQTLL